ncbi:MAG: hypothetical protein EOP49_01005 [Sphingobacteriales bacterium]|nr:MAG: hypothetical protein EOP49_01005 [Sphingobacteriales bacterium]
MKKITSLTFLVLFAATAAAQNWETFKYESGDLLFQELECETCLPLSKVTPATGKHHFTHVGMAYVVSDSVWVIEALEQQVRLVPLKDFVQRQGTGGRQAALSVGRIAAQHQHLTGRALGWALEQRGVPYDHDFTINNDKFFSSELIFEAFKAANKGDVLFDPEPMSFNDPATYKPHPLWKKYFEEIGIVVPEGKTSVSPAALANDENVEIIASF